MKTLTISPFAQLKLVLIMAIMIANLQAQVPQNFSFQAVVRDNSNQLVSNQEIGVRISLLHGSDDGSPLYAETHSIFSNDNGLISILIGTGNTEIGSFDQIAWDAGPYFLGVELDPSGASNHTISSVSQLLSVPYAMYAASSGSSVAGPQGEKGDRGDAGPQGLSAYEIWLSLGNTGTEQDFIASLTPGQGDPVAFRALKTVNQSFSTQNTAIMDSTVFSLGNAWVSNKQTYSYFQAPSAGVYTLSCMVTECSTTGSAMISMDRQRAGSTVELHRIYSSGNNSSFRTSSFTITDYFEAGDIVRLNIGPFNSPPVNVCPGISSYTEFSGFKVK